MRPQRRSKKTNTANGEPQSQQEGRFRLRNIFGLSRSHKQDGRQAQVARPSPMCTERNPTQVKEETIIATGALDERSKAAQCTSAELVETDQPIAEADVIAETESSIPPLAEQPTSETGTDGAVGHDIIKQAARDLWQEAVDQLGEEQKSTLGLLGSAESSPHSAVSAIEDVVANTEKNVAVYNTKRQNTRRDETVLVKIRENARNVLRGTLRVKNIIDAGVQFDPTGYASTAWGVISLGLQLAQNDIDRIDDVLSASAFLTDILCRYANIEANYRDQTVRDIEHLEDHIVRVYVAVLEYSAKVRGNHSMGVGSRILETFYALDKAPLRELQEAVIDADSSMNNWRELIEHEYRIKEAAEIEKRVEGVLEKLQDTSSKLNVLLSAKEQEELTEIMTWLTTMSTASKHDSKIRDRNPYTAEWIFSHDEYLSWLNGPAASNCVLWVHGPYGSGKSVLFANVIKSILHDQDSNKSRICAYWYFDSGTSNNNTNAGLRSIIAQLVGAMRILPKALKKLKKANDIPNREPSKEELLTVLSAVIQESKSQSEIIIAFDALDECPDRAELLEAIATLTETGFGVRIFVTSRPEADIQNQMGSTATGIVPILDKAHDDVERFVMMELEGSAFARYGEDIHNAIKAKLLGRRDRRFRLTALQLQELKDCYDTAMIHETLNDLPEDIEEAYQKALIKISNSRRKMPKIRALLAWIFVAQRKLTLEEVGSVLRIEFPENLLNDCPSCLIRVTDEDRVGWTLFPYPGRYRTVEFDHSSVREFLASERLRTAEDKNISQYFVDVSEANINAAIRCLDIVLAQDEPNSLEISAGEEPMLSYAAAYWISHARLVPNDSTKGSGPLQHPQIDERIEQLFREGHNNSRLNWIRVHDPEEPEGYPDLLRPWEECAQPMYYAALLGLEDIVDSLLKRGAQIMSAEGSFDDAFVAAALHGQVGCLHRMLQAGYAPSISTVYYILREVRWNADGVLSVVLGPDFMNTIVGYDRQTLKTYRIVEEALGNWWSAVPLINALAIPGLPLEITPGIERAARYNFLQGEDALHLLLRKLGNRSITEETLAAIAEYHLPKVMEQALYGAPESAVTAQVALCAAKNESYKKEVFSILLNHVGSQFETTEMLTNMLWSGWWPNAELLDILIRRGGEELPITTKLVESVAVHCDRETMELVLNRGKHVRITEETAVAAASNNLYGAEVMRVLLDCDQRDFEVTKVVLEAASSNQGSPLELIAILINDSGCNELVISHATIENLAKDMKIAAAAVELFLQNSNRIQFAYGAVELAVSLFNADVVKLLLAHPEAGPIAISEDVIVATAGWLGTDGKEVVRLLLEAYLAKNLPITGRIIKSIAASLDEEVLKWLLDLYANPASDIPGLVTSIAMNQHRGPHLLELLLQYKCANIDVNDETIRYSANNLFHAKAMTGRLLSLEGAKFDITEEAVAEVASKLDGEMISLILDRWGGSQQLPEIVLQSAFQNSQHCIDVTNVILDRYDRHIPLTSDIVGIAAANETCGYDLMSVLLDHGECPPLTDAVMVSVAGNGTWGLEILDLIFQLRPRDFAVTTSVLKAIACNEEHGLEMMDSLLNNRRDDICITPEVLACAAKNRESGQAMIGLLLAQPESDSLLTEEVLFAAASNDRCAAEVLTVLLSGQHWDYIPLTVDVMTAVNTPPKLAALLRSLPPDFPISQSMVNAVIRNDNVGAKMTRLLLDHRGTNIQVTKEFIEAAFGSVSVGNDVIRLILRRSANNFPVTDEIIATMARLGDADLITHFLDMRGAAVSISAAVLEAGINNKNHARAPEVLDVLLGHQEDIPITEDLVIQATRHSFAGPELMRVLLKRHGNGVPVTDAVLAATANALSRGAETMSLLAEKRSHDITLTEDFVRQFFWNCTTQKYNVLLSMLWGLGPQSRITEEATAALAAEFSAEELGLLLNRRERQVPITAKVILAAIQNVERRDDIVKLFLNCRPDSIVSEDIIMAIVTNCSAEVVGLLLEKHGIGIYITEELVLAAAEKAYDGVLQLLLRQLSQDTPISARIVTAVAGRESGDAMSFLLGCRGAGVTITEQVINAAVKENIRHGQEVISVLLDQRAEELQIDEAMFLDMVQRFDVNIIHRLYTHLGTDVATTGSIIRAAAANKQYGENIIRTLITKDVLIDPQVLTELARHCNGEMIRYMLQQQGENVQIPEEVIMAVAENDEYGEEVILLLLKERAHDIPLTESILIEMVDRFGATVISTLLNERADDVVLTEKVVMAALNCKDYLDVMKILFNQRPHDIPLTAPIVMAITDKLDTTVMTLPDDELTEHLAILNPEDSKPDLELKDYYYWQALLPVLLDRCDEYAWLNEASILKCATKYTGDFMERLFQKRGKNIAITEDVVMAVIRSNRRAEEVMSVILERAERFPVTENTVAAISGSCSAQALDALLDRHNGNLVLTEKVLVAAAANADYGAEVMERLLKISSIPISRKVVRAAVCNESSGANIMDLILGQRGLDVPITPDVLQSAIWRKNHELLNVLLKHRHHEFPITVSLVKRCSEYAILTLLRRREHYSLVTAQAVAAIAGTFHEAVMEALLDVHGPDIPMTEDVLTAAVTNPEHGSEVISLLLDRQGARLPVTEHSLETIIRWNKNISAVLRLHLQQINDVCLTHDMVRLAAGNTLRGSEFITQLFHLFRKQLPMTERVVKAAATNNNDGLDILTFLLEQWGSDLPITEGVVIAATRNTRGREIIDLLQQQHNIPVTSKILEAAAANPSIATDLVTMLLSRCGSESVVTQAVVSAAIQNREQVKTLLPILISSGKGQGEAIVTERMLEEASDASYEAIATLLPFVPDDVDIGERIMMGIIKCDQADAPLTRMLLGQRGNDIPITAAMVRVARDYDRFFHDRTEILKLLIQHHGDGLHVTEDLVIETVRGFDEQLVTLLLDRENVDTLTSAVIEAALENTNFAAGILQALAELQGQIPVTEKILQDIAHNPEIPEDVMDLLLSNRPPEVSITEDILRAAVSNERLAETMLQHIASHAGGDMAISEDVILAAIMNSCLGKKAMDLLFDQGIAENFPVTEKVINAAAGNSTIGSHLITCFSELKGKNYMRPLLTADVLTKAASNSGEGRKIVKLLLSNDLDIPVTRETLKAAVENATDGSEILALLLDCPGFSVPITSELLEAAAESSAGTKVVRILLGRRDSDARITEATMKAAASNPAAGADLVALFLEQDAMTDIITETVLKAAAKNDGGNQAEKIMAQLLNKGAEKVITTEVVEAAAANPRKEVLIFLLDEMGDKLPLSASVLKAALKSPHAVDKLELLVPWIEQDVSIVKDITSAAVLNSPDLQLKLHFFMQHWGKDFVITEGTVKAAVSDEYNSEVLLSMLFGHQHRDLPVTEGVVIAAAGNLTRADSLIAMLLDERGEDLPITANVLKAAVQNEVHGLNVLRQFYMERREDILLTEEVLKAAAELPGPAIRFFLEDHWQVRRSSS